MRKIRAGYAGGTTWTDLQIGKVLDALDATGERDNTLVMYVDRCVRCVDRHPRRRSRPLRPMLPMRQRAVLP